MTYQKILEKTGALKKGHFKLSSGLHSGFYLQCALALQHPEYAEFFGRELAKKVKDMKIDAVISPALGGVIIGQETARQLKVRAIFGERVEGRFTLRRGFTIKPGERLLVVEDVVTTGGSSLEIGNVIKLRGGTIAAYAAICDRSGGKTDFKNNFYGLVKFNFRNYKERDCPLCKKKIPLNAPGSRFNTAG